MLKRFANLTKFSQFSSFIGLFGGYIVCNYSRLINQTLRWGRLLIIPIILQLVKLVKIYEFNLIL